jgi:predicted kinase
MKNFLICTVGLPRSGKSTWSRKQNHPIVNPDSIRFAIHGQRYIQAAEPYVWAIAKTMVHSLFLAGHSTVILDATNLTLKRRQEWISNNWKTFYYPILTTKEECIRRAAQENDHYIIDVIKRMSEEYQPLTVDEQIWE